MNSEPHTHALNRNIWGIQIAELNDYCFTV